MKKEFVFPLVVGIILGALVMIFWQFNARLSNVSLAMTQLEQATNQNTKTVSDVVAFINQATSQNKAATTPAAQTPAQ
jgi:cell division protein FtsL